MNRFAAKAVAGFAAALAFRNAGWHFVAYPDSEPKPLHLQQLMDFLGAPPDGTHLEFPFDGHDIDEFVHSGIAADLMPGGYFCIHPGARSRDKC